jgi:chromosome segregation ATPase
MYYILLAIAALIAVVLPLAAYALGRRAGVSAGDEDAAQLREESQQLDAKLVETLSEVDSLASKAQVDYLQQQRAELRKSLTEQQQALAQLTSRVDQTRSDVQSRETEQQELRAMKVEDEEAINRTLTSYNEFSAESLSLEQKLAESLRTLDAMTSEIKMTTDQQAVFAELSNALTQASAQLRDVIIDHQSANDRLANLASRFADLENEYSKLVEQQLAG